MIMRKIKPFYKKSIILYLIICIVIQPTITVSAEDSINKTYYELGYGNTLFSFQDLLSRYEGNSTTYQRNMIEYRIQALSEAIADENYDSVNSQYLEVLQKIVELNETKGMLISYRDTLFAETESISAVTSSSITMNAIDGTDNSSLIAEINAQIASIDMQLSQYNSSRKSLEMNVADTGLQEDIADFYGDYEKLITKEVESKLKHEFMKDCYNLIIYKEQVDYSNSYQDYLNLLLQADTIKYKLGLITQLTLDTDNINVLHNNRVIAENQKKYDLMLRTIKNDTAIPDNAKIVLNLIYTKKQFDVNDTINKFISSNSSYHQLQNYIRSYRNYLSSAGTASASSYRQTELKIRYYQLQKQELENKIKAYVKEAISSYDTAFQSRDAAWKELQVKAKGYNVTKKNWNTKGLVNFNYSRHFAKRKQRKSSITKAVMKSLYGRISLIITFLEAPHKYDGFK